MTTENPYFEEVAGGITVGANRASWDDRAIEVLEQREELVQEYAWAIPNEEAIETVAEHAPIVEVGAGAGYWAWCVEQLDVRIAATDPEPPRPNTYTEIITKTATEAIECAREIFVDGYTLFLCWPPYGNEMAADAVEAFEGDTLIYVGEGRGGCTGDDRFHRLLHQEWELVETVAIPTYLGIHDRLEVWSR
ncbi:hypothetical protein PhiCh1p84 [Natrialba phage PhiCh1]|uniref:Virus protein phiCh1-VP83 n=2 Tax=root TaxID=1 RepID=D3T2D5_NATMM|nr:hypothetical protein [Natrialba magadii]NP_666001.1 hypothetical protein PhiCh1p84 [Natrialba phage PhiCh1]YP_010078110.1 uncharacterized protein KMC42_gp80 [Natrialba phage PhiCh1]AAM88757.1 unknown [Natrialba phage PhiCh1]ADD07744.1 virus protein phiCh1-VP83 [Natrialba magadii ATCC 43099]ELY22991.1 hypothetical protein C500_21045 [Natrialba magadii ATCC 43099]QBJ01261.1 uncharacterized protein PhiCh1_395 [Natrialba phage PhiCh1]